jgi:ketosteroid isomerase-like protein
MKALLPGVAVLLLAACGAASHGPAAVPASAAAAVSPDPALREQVLAAERAFADTMARRDFAAFGRFVDAEAVFFGSTQVMRGRQAVLAGWQRYFTGQRAPFSWEPDTAEVLDSGTLAFTAGPVRDETGTLIARFNSIWRRNAAGQWQVIFDKGSPLEQPAASPAQ